MFSWSASSKVTMTFEARLPLMSMNTALISAATASSNSCACRFTQSNRLKRTFGCPAHRTAARSMASAETSMARTDAARFAIRAVASP